MRVLFVTIEWPFSDQPYRAPFVKTLVAFLQNYMEVVPLPLPLRQNPLNIINYQRTIKQAFRQYQCDHIHCYSLNSLLLVNPRHYPVSASAIGSDVFGMVNKRGNYAWFSQLPFHALKHKLRYLKSLRCVSRNIADQLSRYISPKLPVKVIPNGIDTGLFPAKERTAACEALGWDQEVINVFFPGNPRKGEKHFARAHRLMEAAKGALAVHFHVFPGVEHSKMNDYYCAADVVLVTSRHEGSSNSLKEAMLCDTPVLTTDVGDVRHWLSLDVEGCLIEDDISTADFVQLLKHCAAVKRKRGASVNQAIASRLPVREKARELADLICSAP